jgi:hypothetical protein
MKGIFSAEYGHVRTGLVSFSLKSGGNNYHGSLFENFRNQDLNARAFFSPTQLPYHQNNFGGTLSGPVRIPKLYNGKDRTFFMISSDNSYFRGADQIQAYTTPTAAFLHGDFSSLRTNTGATRLIYDPDTTAAAANGSVTRTPFPGNIIPQNRISPISAKVAAFYPPPNLPGNDANLTAPSGGVSLDSWYLNFKIDHRFTEKHSISAMYNYTNIPRLTYSNPYVGTPLLNGLAQTLITHEVRFSYDYVINPAVFNHFQFGLDRFIDPVRSYSYGGDWPNKLGISGVGGDGTMPVFGFTSDSYPTAGSPRWDNNAEENIMLRNTTSILHGIHSIKFGFESRRQRVITRNERNQAGTFNFNFKETGLNASSSTGNSFASFLLGYADSANISTPLNVSSYRPYYAMFVQDDLKLSPRLTLNLGLRWDLELPPFEQYDRASLFDLNTPNPGAGNLPGALIFAGKGPGRIGSSTFDDTYYRSFGPRAGIAYQLGRNTVVRTGYAILYSSNQLVNVFDGYSTTANFVSPDNGNTPAVLLANGMPTNFPKPPIIDPTFDNRNNVTTDMRKEVNREPMTQNFRFDVQRQLPGGYLLDTAYVWTHGTHLNAAGLRTLNQVPSSYLSLGSLLTANITSPAAAAAGIFAPYPGFTGTVAQALRPYPQVLNITSLEDKLGSSVYNAFEVKLQKRFSSGFQYLVAYTNSKLLTSVQDAPGSITSSAIQDAANRRAERALSTFDTPQNFWVSLIYELPVGPGKAHWNRSELAAKFIGGWSISTVLNYESGVPAAITDSNSLPIFNAGLRPNRVLGTAGRNDIGYSSFDPSTNRLFNPGAFQVPAPFTFGNAAPRLSDVRAYGIRKEDLSLRKNTRITERVRVEFNAQAFNIFNRPNWGRPIEDQTSSDFGKITTAGPGRFLQLGAKLHF